MNPGRIAFLMPLAMTGIYVHLPFCTVHCTYCPFAISTDLSLQERYTDALVREIAAAPASAADSVYFGGGTPSRTSPGNLGRVVSALRQTFDLVPGTEFSMEANPEDVSPRALEAWTALGVNRISIGVQAFHDRELTVIGRVHDRAQAVSAVRAAAATGMRTNLDLILGLPGQTVESFRETLDLAVTLGAGHLSLYMLDLEERTPLEVQVARGRVTLPEDEQTAALYLEAVEFLEGAGLAQYEVSNFARAGEQCRHNLRYWNRGEYFGFGLAAHSFQGARRYANSRDMRVYLERAPDARDFSEILGPGEERREAILLQLRRVDGMCYEEIERLCGQEGVAWIERGLRDGWLRRRDERVAFTPAGFLQSNDFISQLF